MGSSTSHSKAVTTIRAECAGKAARPIAGRRDRQTEPLRPIPWGRKARAGERREVCRTTQLRKVEEELQGEDTERRPYRQITQARMGQGQNNLAVSFGMRQGAGAGHK